jgi:hypothetical protein
MVALCLTTAACSSSPTPSAQPPIAGEAKPAEAPAAESTNWFKSEKSDPMDGTKEIAVMTSAMGQPSGTLIIRFKGKKLDVYVNTDEIVDDESASVRVKFDDAAPVRQIWTRSTDYKAIFSPDPFGLLARLQLSNKFYIEYRPYQRTPDTIIFNVTGLSAALPQAEMAIQKKKHDENNAAEAALRARILPHVHECNEKVYDAGPPFLGPWCWTDPNDILYNHDSTPFATKEEAVRDAMRMARDGLAFTR